MTVAALVSKAAGGRIRPSREGACSQAGMRWPAQSRPNMPSMLASLESDRRRLASMRRSWQCW